MELGLSHAIHRQPSKYMYQYNIIISFFLEPCISFLSVIDNCTSRLCKFSFVFKLYMNIPSYIYIYIVMISLYCIQVGTGFSYTDKGGLSITEEEVADNLYSCITQFLTVFSEYQASDFYITGEVHV